jgi:hypothetical protein
MPCASIDWQRAHCNQGADMQAPPHKAMQAPAKPLLSPTDTNQGSAAQLTTPTQPTNARQLLLMRPQPAAAAAA